MKERSMSRILASLLFTSLLAACGEGGESAYPEPKDPDRAAAAIVDRFSSTAGVLMVRGPNASLPAAGAAIDFDQPPFITRGLGPDGRHVAYYNFDVRPTTPANIYVLFTEGATEPLGGQLNIVDDIPGDADYNDLWRVVRVDVPADYVPNAITSADGMMARGWKMTPTETLVNCPIVPAGSVARGRVGGGDAGLTRGWYRDQIIHYFNFAEAPLHVVGDGTVPVTPIFVAFDVNPDQPGGGPPSGFRTEPGTAQTHNVIGALPGAPGYSPLWSVQVYDNAAFSTVSDLPTAAAAHLLGTNVANVNCPLASAGT
jgi:hypothetical protein